MAGNLCATVDSPTDKELFKFRLMNRPLLVLRGEFGFVDFKSASNEKVGCNKSTYDIIQVENGENGAYHLKGGNGKYWCVEEDSSISASGSIPVDFFISLFDDAYFSLKTKDGAYVRGEQSGIFRANGNEVEKATLWEY
jgi:fascin 1/2